MFRSDFRREAWVGVFKIYFTLEAKANQQEKAGIKYGITSSEKVIFMQSFTLFQLLSRCQPCVFSCLYIVVYQHYISVDF